ncbi:hypothetical protein F4X86_03380 [Candidatus Saccharibacteria bacterium]|nr:hypothetical protein [Candidatus Saccharibacteria bacterium]
MKSKDIVPLVIVVVISTILAYVASSFFIDGTPESRKIETVNTIEANFPNEAQLEEIFHKDIIDTFGPIPLGDE